MITVRKATLNDCSFFASNLRTADKNESEALGLSVLAALQLSVTLSEEALVGEADDKPFALFGVGKGGIVWLVGTDEIKKHRVYFLRHSVEWFDKLHERYSVLWNWIDSRNRLHIRYLRWLGCEFTGRVMNIGPDKVPFLEFTHLCVSPS